MWTYVRAQSWGLDAIVTKLWETCLSGCTQLTGKAGTQTRTWGREATCFSDRCLLCVFEQDGFCFREMKHCQQNAMKSEN